MPRQERGTDHLARGQAEAARGRAGAEVVPMQARLDERLAALRGAELAISASLGQASHPDAGTSEDELIRVADASSYRIKTGRRGSA